RAWIYDTNTPTTQNNSEEIAMMNAKQEWIKVATMVAALCSFGAMADEIELGEIEVPSEESEVVEIEEPSESSEVVEIEEPSERSEVIEIEDPSQGSEEQPMIEVPELVAIRELIHRGTGCPAGTTSVNLSSDYQSLVFSFDRFIAEVGPGLMPAA